MSVRARWILLASLGSMVVSACGSSVRASGGSTVPDPGRPSASTETTAGSVSAPGLTLTGAPVRGASIDVAIGGLQRFAGREVSLTLKQAEGMAGGTPGAYAIVASTVVSEAGGATVSFRVPNSLSGEDDIIPLPPEGEHVLSIASQDGDGEPLLVPFPIVAAEVGAAYRVEVAQGTGECGSPLSWIDFDGQSWLPDGSSTMPAAGRATTGAFTLLTADTARFDGADGSATTYLRAGTGWAC